MNSTPENVTTHIGIVQIMKAALKSYGLDPEPLFRNAELSSPNTQGRVAAVALQKVWRQAVVASKDEAFGLTFAKHLRPGTLNGLGFACIASNNLHDAFNRLVRYYRLISSGGEVRLDDVDDQIRLWYKIPAPPGRAAPASLDAALGLFIQLCRVAQGEDFCPSRVELQRTAPLDVTPFNEFFQCPIVFNAPENALFFNREALNAPLPMASPELARANDQVVIDYLQQFDQNNVVHRVRAVMIEWLPSGAPKQDKVASELCLSARTLQRKLSDEGFSYKELLEDLRLELALQYLQSGQRSIGEICYLLGFSEPSNFTRSFKRWTGKTPQAFQQQSVIEIYS